MVSFRGWNNVINHLKDIMVKDFHKNIAASYNKNAAIYHHSFLKNIMRINVNGHLIVHHISYISEVTYD